MTNPFDFSGKVALVNGLRKCFAEAGASVSMTDRAAPA